MAWQAAIPMIASLFSGKKSEYKPYEFKPEPTKEKPKSFSSYPGMDQTDLEASIASAASEAAGDGASQWRRNAEYDKAQDDKKKEGYGDTADWVAAAASLLSNLEAERQAKQAALMAQRNQSANYGINAMSAAGSALGRLGQGRMSGMGLGSMAGV